MFILKMTMIALTIMVCTYSAPPCKDIVLQGYQFSLSSLSSLGQVNILTGAEFISISMCSLISCSSLDPKNNNGYVLVKKNQTVCAPFTSNQAGPLLQYYKLINQNNPSKGISIDFIPAYLSSITALNQTLVLQNQTINYINTTQTNSLNYAKVLVYCDADNSQAANCTKTQTLVSTQAINSTYTIYNYQKYLQCDLHVSQGCPKLAVNSFWQFLVRNRIVFAIIFWICALFLILLGYLAIRITILLYGIFTGCLFGVIFMAENYENFYQQNDWIFIYIICIAVVMGFLFGIFLLTVPRLGYVNIGVFVAALFSLLLQNSVLFLTGSLLAFYITFGATALVMAIIALMELRYFIIFCSSFTGAFLFIRPLGFFLPGYPNELISGKNFKISVATPWQFYLYLGSIIILTILGIVIQRCINRKMFRNNQANGGYYLENDGTLRERLQKVFQFKEIKDLIKSGKKQFVQLKNMITDESAGFGKIGKKGDYGQDQQDDDQGHYIEMQKMQKIMKKQKENKQKEKQKEKQRYREKQKSKTKGKEKKSQSQDQQAQQISDQLQEIRDSDSIKPVKKGKNK